VVKLRAARRERAPASGDAGAFALNK
jgi:hypothetical protein